MKTLILRLVSYIKKNIFFSITSIIAIIITHYNTFIGLLTASVRTIRSACASLVGTCYYVYTGFTISFISHIKEYRIILHILFLIILLFFVVQMLIRLFRYFSGYIRLWGDMLKNLGILILRAGKGSFYALIYKNWRATYSLFIYNTLVSLDESLKEFPVIQTPEAWRRIFKNITAPLGRIFQPLSKALTTGLRFWKKIEKTSDESSVLLASKEKLFSSTNELPDEIIQQFTISGDTKRETCYFQEKWVALIMEGIEKWKQGYSSNILIYGEKGTGKTKLLEYIKENLAAKEEVVQLSLQRDPDMKLDNRLRDVLGEYNIGNTGNRKRIVLIDDLERFFLRHIGGYDLIHGLLHSILQSGSDILWIVTTGSSFYDYIRYILPINSIFQYFINGDDITLDSLINIFQYKVKTGGYTFHILPDKQMLKKIKKRLRIKLISPEEVDLNLKKLFFNVFLVNGKGNMYFHFHYFLKSLKSIRSTKLFLSQPVFPVIDEVVKNLGPTDFRILQTLFLHKELDKKHIAEVLLMDIKTVDFSIQIMQRFGIIQKNETDYYIAPVNYNGLLKSLKTRNIL